MCVVPLAHAGSPRTLNLTVVVCAGNKRLQAMMASMTKDRGGSVFGMDHRYCVDNGAMIAQAGILAFEKGVTMPVEECDVTQRCVMVFGWRAERDSHTHVTGFGLMK